MSQYGAASKNPPWIRNPVQQVPAGVVQQQQQQQMQTQMLGQTVQAMTNQAMMQYQQTQQVFQSPLGIQQVFSPLATVSYPTPRALNAAAFQTTTAPCAPPSSQPSRDRVFTGVVTKVHDNFGFIDEDVFFQKSCCVKGSSPVLGDRVLVEAAYNASMPFKWNATRVQVLPMPGALGQQQAPGNNNGSSNFMSRNNQRNKSALGARRERSRDRIREEEEEMERKKRRDERARERDKERRSPAPRHRSKSPRPPQRRRTRVMPRYMVHIPKVTLSLPEADVLELRRRYSNMYIPSDFFSTNLRWADAFPPTTPFTLEQPCSFVVMDKEVDPVIENTATLDPSDADYLFSAKVMLVSLPSMEEIFRRCCPRAEEMEKEKDKEKEEESRDFVHPTRLINFLVGLRGKSETMAIGGAWSPSLDGPHPDTDPSVLIKTAIRTCRALTGIDLSQCTQWYRFLEIYYCRAESTHKGRVVPARVETVVIFLPDIWSCVPTRLEWDSLHLSYQKQLKHKLEPDQEPGGEDKEAEESTADTKKEPTHYSKLDPKSLKVTELRQELEARGMSPKGLKSQLTARLAKVLKHEEEQEGQKMEEDNKQSEKAEAEDGVDDEKDEEKRKQEERERAALIKRYTLPEMPHIVVHPSRTAKSGKFDCSVMSLSVLLDYRPEDSKEHSFEVSLFAELFNEMLMRDFGYRIYCALCDAPELAKEDDKDRKKEKDKKDEKRSDKEEYKDDKSAKEKVDDEKDDISDNENDDDNDSRGSKKDKEKRHDKDKKKKEHLKLFTEDVYLLLACVYFDQSHCGYILEKDVEDLLFILGLNLSRAQVRKLVQKVVTRGSLHYRKLTDKPRAEEDMAKPLEQPPKLLPLSNKKPLQTVDGSDTPPNKRARKEAAEDGLTAPEGFVRYQGAMLDIEQLMSQLKRSETCRREAEDKMVVLREELSVMNEKSAHLSDTVQELSAEMDDYRDRLNNTSARLADCQDVAEAYRSKLKNIFEIVLPVKQESDYTCEDQKDIGSKKRKVGTLQESRWSNVNSSEGDEEVTVIKEETEDEEDEEVDGTRKTKGQDEIKAE